MPWRNIGEWRYSSTFSDLSTRWRWVVSFTPQEKKNRYPFDRWLGEARVDKRKILHCQELNPSRPAHRQSLYRPSYPDCMYFIIITYKFSLPPASTHFLLGLFFNPEDVYVPSKCWGLSELHGFTTQMTILFKHIQGCVWWHIIHSLLRTQHDTQKQYFIHMSLIIQSKYHRYIYVSLTDRCKSISKYAWFISCVNNIKTCVGLMRLPSGGGNFTIHIHKNKGVKYG
jgi:hypothetical protein